MSNNYYIFVFILLFASVFSCQSKHSLAKLPDDFSKGGIVIFNDIHTIDHKISFDEEVVFYPGAYITTVKEGQIEFNSRVTIIGETQVFDENVNIRFGQGTIGTINPCWFGAKGYDDLDDTRAFQRALEIAKACDNTIIIKVPIGRFIISETLVLENERQNESAINFMGEAISTNSISGSCLQWRGISDESLVRVRNNAPCRIENIEFTSYSSTHLKYNLELKPFINQLEINHCSFSGCKGIGAANINLNAGNNAQVSEIKVSNCVFRSLTEDNVHWTTESAIIGGLANTKNFYFDHCSFLGYTIAAINIDISDIVRINDCTFSVNETDIVCNLCNSMIAGNYSEQSKSFFKSGTSDNIGFTTIMNNYFDGSPDNDFVIRGGSGSLILINNSFGGTGGNDIVNKIVWSQRENSSITSIGNFYRNSTGIISPFMFDELKVNSVNVFNLNDLIGNHGTDFKRLKDTLKD